MCKMKTTSIYGHFIEYNLTYEDLLTEPRFADTDILIMSYCRYNSSHIAAGQAIQIQIQNQPRYSLGTNETSEKQFHFLCM